MNRSFMFAVLMVFSSSVCQPVVEAVVQSTKVILETLAVALAEGWLWAYPLTAARLSANIATMN